MGALKGTVRPLIHERLQYARAEGEVGRLDSLEPAHRTDGAGVQKPNGQAIVQRTSRSSLPKESNVCTNPILQQDLADLRVRERLATAEKHLLTANTGDMPRASVPDGARRAVGRAVVHVGAWLAGERWEPATPLPAPVLKAVP